MTLPLFKDDNTYFLCSLCQPLGYYYPSSEYLARVFSNPRALWVANMVTHYRHNHVVYYDNSVGYASYRGAYESFKHEVNERAKRQIIRKCAPFLRAHGVTAADFAELRGTTEETMALAVKVLGGEAPARQSIIVLRGQLTLGQYGAEGF